MIRTVCWSNTSSHYLYVDIIWNSVFLVNEAMVRIHMWLILIDTCLCWCTHVFLGMKLKSNVAFQNWLNEWRGRRASRLQYGLLGWTISSTIHQYPQQWQTQIWSLSIDCSLVSLSRDIKFMKQIDWFLSMIVYSVFVSWHTCNRFIRLIEMNILWTYVV
jgi:hypothetical protein